MSYKSTRLSYSPTAYWPLDETSGTSAADATGNANTGTASGSGILGGATGIPADGSGKCALFGGSDEIDIAIITGLPSGTDHYTVDGWFFTSSTVDPQTIFAMGDTGTTDHALLFRLESSATAVTFDWANDDLLSPTESLMGAWHYVAITYDGTNRTIYLDGTQIQQDTPGTPNLAGTAAAIGAIQSIGQQMVGRLAHIAVTRGTALPSGTIAALWTAGSTLTDMVAGDNASYFWIGLAANLPTPANAAPNTVCRAYETDTGQFLTWDWATSAWLVEAAPPPANPQGASTSQQACNIAGYLANGIIRVSLQKGIDAIQTDLTTFGYGVSIIGLIPGVGIIYPAFVNALKGLYTAMVSGTLQDYQDALNDPTLFSKITCAIFNAIMAAGQVTSGNFATLLANVRAVSYTHADVITAMGNYISDLGYGGLAQLQPVGALLVYDCSGCGGGVSTGPSDPLSAAVANEAPSAQGTLTTDVELTTPGLIYAGPSVPLQQGTWLVSADLPIVAGDAGVVVIVRIWDAVSGTVYALQPASIPPGNAAPVHVEALIELAAPTTITVSVEALS